MMFRENYVERKWNLCDKAGSNIALNDYASM